MMNDDYWSRGDLRGLIISYKYFDQPPRMAREPFQEHILAS